MPGCDHDDISHTDLASTSPELYFRNLRFLLESPNETQYKKRRLETGISKPTIFLGLRTENILGVPGCFGSDIMHLAAFNIPDLLLSLWRGTLDNGANDPVSNWPWTVLTGAVWESHGQDVAAATPHLPSSFGRPPRNIAEKINSGYKAWEFLLYLYFLAPVLLFGTLPTVFWQHFCKLVRGMRILLQHSIRREDLILADNLLRSFAHEYELLYYERREDRIHFVRQSIHALYHLAPEVTRIGPPICSSQWTMERTIGNLGQEIRQPSNPYANLSYRGLLRCQVNALTCMSSDHIDSDSLLPRGAIDLGNGFVLLRAQDKLRPMRICEARMLRRYLVDNYRIEMMDTDESEWCPDIARWARLRLPNGQIVRSRWKEELKLRGQVRVARHVKFIVNDTVHFGEVYYYFRCRIKDKVAALAMISVFSHPHSGLLRDSLGTVLSCTYSGDDSLIVIDASSIQSLIAMVPHQPPGWNEIWFFVIERPGLDVINLAGISEETSDADCE